MEIKGLIPVKSAAIIAVIMNHVEDRQDWPHTGVIMANKCDKNFEWVKNRVFDIGLKPKSLCVADISNDGVPHYLPLA